MRENLSTWNDTIVALATAPGLGAIAVIRLSGKEAIEVPTIRRKWSDYIEVKGARENNLKNIDVKDYKKINVYNTYFLGFVFI